MWGGVISCLLILADGAKTPPPARSSLPLCLPRPLPCPFLPLPLPLPLAMSGSGGLKSLISRERKGSVAVPGVEGRRGECLERRQVQLQLEVPKGHYVRE